MTNSGHCASRVSMAALKLLKGKTSWPSRRRSSVTICTMVTSSSINKTFAIASTLVKAPRQSKRDPRPVFASMLARHQLAQFENRQEHANHNAAHHHSQEDNEQRLNQRGQPR